MFTYIVRLESEGHNGSSKKYILMDGWERYNATPILFRGHQVPSILYVDVTRCVNTFVSSDLELWGIL